MRNGWRLLLALTAFFTCAACPSWAKVYTFFGGDEDFKGRQFSFEPPEGYFLDSPYKPVFTDRRRESASKIEFVLARKPFSLDRLREIYAKAIEDGDYYNRGEEGYSWVRGDENEVEAFESNGFWGRKLEDGDVSGLKCLIVTGDGPAVPERHGSSYFFPQYKTIYSLSLNSLYVLEARLSADTREELERCVRSLASLRIPQVRANPSENLDAFGKMIERDLTAGPLYYPQELQKLTPEERLSHLKRLAAEYPALLRDGSPSAEGRATSMGRMLNASFGFPDLLPHHIELMLNTPDTALKRALASGVTYGGESAGALFDVFEKSEEGDLERLAAMRLSKAGDGRVKRYVLDRLANYGPPPETPEDQPLPDMEAAKKGHVLSESQLRLVNWREARLDIVAALCSSYSGIDVYEAVARLVDDPDVRRSLHPEATRGMYERSREPESELRNKIRRDLAAHNVGVMRYALAAMLVLDRGGAMKTLDEIEAADKEFFLKNFNALRNAPEYPPGFYPPVKPNPADWPNACEIMPKVDGATLDALERLDDYSAAATVLCSGDEERLWRIYERATAENPDPAGLAKNLAQWEKKEAGRFVERLLASPNEVRQRAGLGCVAYVDDPVKSLAPFTKHQSKVVRELAINVLMDQKTPEAARFFVSQGMEGKPYEASRQFGKLWDDALIEKALAETDPKERLKLANLAGVSQSPEMYRIFARYVADPDQELADYCRKQLFPTMSWEMSWEAKKVATAELAAMYAGAETGAKPRIMSAIFHIANQTSTEALLDLLAAEGPKADAALTAAMKVPVNDYRGRFCYSRKAARTVLKMLEADKGGKGEPWKSILMTWAHRGLGDGETRPVMAKIALERGQFPIYVMDDPKVREAALASYVNNTLSPVNLAIAGARELVDTAYKRRWGSDDKEKIQTVEALGWLGDKRGADFILPLLNSREPKVVEAAVVALGRIGDPSAYDAIVPLASSKTPAVRGEALAALGKFGDKKAVNLALNSVKGDGGQFRRDTDVRRISGYPGLSVSEAAVEALGWLGDAEAIDVLLGLVWDRGYGGKKVLHPRTAMAISDIAGTPGGDDVVKWRSHFSQPVHPPAEKIRLFAANWEKTVTIAVEEMKRTSSSPNGSMSPFSNDERAVLRYYAFTFDRLADALENVPESDDKTLNRWRSDSIKGLRDSEEITKDALKLVEKHDKKHLATAAGDAGLGKRISENMRFHHELQGEIEQYVGAAFDDRAEAQRITSVFRCPYVETTWK